MQPRHFEAVIFSAKAAVATVVAALGYKLFQLPGVPWVAAVSAVLVTQPNLHSSFKASLMRVVANLAGAFGGAALLAATGQPITAMAVGVMVTGLVCYLLKQDDALRPAFVAVIIVTLIGGAANGTIRATASPPSSSAACARWSWDFYSTNFPACPSFQKRKTATNPTQRNNFQHEVFT